MIFRRTRDVPTFQDYLDYRPFLRRDFEYRCAYCLRHEFFFGGGEAGEVDHHRPLRLYPELRNEYGNLYWSCRRCNAIKSGKWPSAHQLAQGFRFVDPCAEDHEDHWQTHSDGLLTPLTAPGRYTIRHIQLDRPVLTEFRRFLSRLQEQVREIEAELQNSNLSLDTRESLLHDLRSVTGLIAPPVFSL